MGVYTSHTKSVQLCIFGSVAVFVMLLYIFNVIYGGTGVNFDFFYHAVVLYFIAAFILSLCVIFSRVDALYLSFLRGGRRLSRAQLALVLASVYLGSLLLFGIVFYFMALDFQQHIRLFLDSGSIRTLVGEFCMIPLLLSILAVLVSNIIAIYRGVRICKKDDSSSVT